MKTISAPLNLLIAALIMLFSAINLNAQDPDIEANEAEAIRDYFRTSELPGENPTRGGKRVSAPAGAMRVGCICMDETHSATRSTGACSGHGGVRFWLYKTVEGDTVRVLTGRHERHPHALDSVERSELIQPEERSVTKQKSAVPQVVIIQNSLPPSISPYVDYPMHQEPHPWSMGWPDVVALAIVCTTVVLLVRMFIVWFTQNAPWLQDALPDLLRPGKRPPEDEDGEDFDQTRL